MSEIIQDTKILQHEVEKLKQMLNANKGETGSGSTMLFIEIGRVIIGITLCSIILIRKL